MEVREVTAGQACPERAKRVEGQEAAIKARSAELRKELSVRDLAFAQILFIVGLQWVGVAAKQGPPHVIFWLIAIALFYLPSAAVAVWLNRAMPLEGGLYQWAKIGFNERLGFIVAWNLWLFGILNMTNIGLQFTQYLGYIFGPRVAAVMAQNWVIATASALVTGALVWITILGLRVGKWVHTVGGVLIFYALTYLAMFAVPLFGLRRAKVRPPWWVKLCALSGLLMTVLYVSLSVLPIIPVGSRTVFALKIAGLIVLTNLIGVALYASRKRRIPRGA